MTARESTLFPHSVAPSKAGIQSRRAKPWQRASFFSAAEEGSHQLHVSLPFRLSGPRFRGGDRYLAGLAQR